MKASTRMRRAVSGGGRRGLLVLLTLATVGILALGMIRGGPQDDPAASSPGSPSNAPTTPSPSPSDQPLSMAAAKPESIKIPAMKVDTSLVTLGQQKSSQLVELPKKPGDPGWYKKSATPGELGVSTVVGYIRKSAKTPGVFARLGKLDKGNRIMITRKDGSVATFKVDKIKSYPTKKFSANEVYGQSEPQAELRVITCGGTLKPKDPPSNVVVYAHLIKPNKSGA